MIDKNMKAQVSSWLENLSGCGDDHYVDDNNGQELKNFAEAIAEPASGCLLAVQMKESCAGPRLPSTERMKLHELFDGVPSGMNFLLHLALLHVSGHPPKIDEGVLKAAARRNAGFRDLYSASCQNCPDVVQALNALAAVNPRIQHRAIDGAPSDKRWRV